MKLKDFKGIFNHSIVTVENISNPYGDYYIVTLKPDKELVWTPGEHGAFLLPDRKVRGKMFRGFSIASIYEEGVIILGTRTGESVSSFKSELIAMKKGERVKIIGPFGWFTLQDEFSPLVMIAGGVGITPIRALLKQLDGKTDRQVDVIYASNQFFLFDEEIGGVINRNASFHLHKTKSKEETESILHEMAMQNENKAYYYISGARLFIKSIKRRLSKQSIKRRRMINDPFFGY